MCCVSFLVLSTNPRRDQSSRVGCVTSEKLTRYPVYPQVYASTWQISSFGSATRLFSVGSGERILPRFARPLDVSLRGLPVRFQNLI